MKPSLYFLFVLFFPGCIICKKHTDAVKNFTVCFDDNYTGLDTLINCSGFYYTKPDSNLIVNMKKIEPHDTVSETFIFYKNGFWVKNIADIYYFSTPLELIGSNGGDWGLYTLCEDTIKAQFVESPGGTSFEHGEWWFKIIDRNTIQLLDFKYRTAIPAAEVKNAKLTYTSKCKFLPLKVFPNPEKSWIIGQKWFWCNKEKYYEWKRNRKK